METRSVTRISVLGAVLAALVAAAVFLGAGPAPGRPDAVEPPAGALKPDG